MTTRSTLLAALGLAPVVSRTALASALKKTVSASEGPYYPTSSMRPADINNDLVKIDQNVTEAGGEVLLLNGQVTDTSGTPLDSVRVEIWQCDVNGRYLHTADSNPAAEDPDFQGFGHTFTDESGLYEFRTIKPVSYPGRTPHIHVKVISRKTELTTQFYLKGHPQNARDGLFNRMTPAEQASVEMDVVSADNRLTATVNIVC